ncbi:MAG: 2-keto-4-pentenoate hydratase [Pseudoclavibacter sp.]
MRDLIGRDDIPSAYAVQRINIAARAADGARVLGHKIGLTSLVVQHQLNVDQPDFGILLDDMEHRDGESVPISEFLQPRVEAEIAFVLRRDLRDGALELPQVREAVDYAVAAIEIVDSRISGWDISFGDTVADNASAGAYVLGTRRLTLDEFEPRETSMSMTVSGQEDSTGTGAACLGDPLLALQWLAKRTREFGEPLLAGQVILSGALGPMRPVTAGTRVAATISGLGTVSCTFTGGTE